ncbi:MAG: GNAT family N-acetyltransferase [Microthrixaceae bacterium]
MTVRIRPARAAEGGALIDIERAAGARFRDVGMPEIADDDPGSVEELARYAEDGRSWVAVDDANTPLGYVLVDVVDGNAHIEQLSVLPAAQGAGLGRALLDQVATWAVGRGAPALTLTTFRDVPWNAPLYEHLGFRDLAEPELGAELRAVRDTETAHGLDPTTRVCMIRPVHAVE